MPNQILLFRLDPGFFQPVFFFFFFFARWKAGMELETLFFVGQPIKSLSNSGSGSVLAQSDYRLRVLNS